MRVLLIGYGSRGDVQPLLALGRGLQQASYDVSIAAGSNFRDWITEEGFRYEQFRTNMQDMMNSDSGKEWIEASSASPLKESQNMKRLMNEYAPAMGEDLLQMAEGVDVMVSGLPTFMLTYGIAKKLDKKHLTIMLAPLNPTANAYATMVPSFPGRTIFTNRLSGYIGQYFTYWIFQEASNAFLLQNGMSQMSYRDYIRAYNSEVPVIYGVSPLVMPHAADWHHKIFVTGYWFHETPDWTPPPELTNFLNAGEPPVYIGFGSMANKNPEKTSHTMISALRKTGKRGIIMSGWGGLKSEQRDDNILYLEQAPHDWLFPRMSAIIDHGGSGTTAAALRAGIPNTVVSHMADQPYWGRRIYELGIGAPLIRRHNLTAEQLANAIEAMTSNRDMQRRATNLGHAIRQENGVQNAVDTFNTLLL